MSGPPRPVRNAREWAARAGIIPWYAGGRAFSPLNPPDLVLWLDASDAATITESSGAVSQWSDKSQSGFHAMQATSSRQPTLVAAALNGKPVIRFDGVNDYLTLVGAGDIARNVAGFTAFMVVASTKLGVQRVLHINTNDSTQFRHRFAVYRSSATGGPAALAARRLDEHSETFITGDPLDGTHQIVTAWADFTNAAIELFQNGVSTNTGALTNGGNTSDTASSRVLIGAVTSDANPNGEQFFEGDIAEVICYQRALSPTEREQVEAYLADKWGITLA